MQEARKQSKNLRKEGEGEAGFEIKERCLIIRLNEELDHHNALKIRERADKLIDYNNIKHIIFDFSGAGFMDSAGIGIIMGRYKKVIFIGGKTAVTNVSSGIDRIFKLSGLYKIIEKYDTVDAALKMLQKG